MNKLDVQKRVTQHGEPLPLDKFSWDEKALLFLTKEHNCVIDFTGVDDVTIISGDYSTQIAGDYSTQKAGDYSTQKAGDYSTQTAGRVSTQTAEHKSNQIARYKSTQTSRFGATQKAGPESIQTAGDWSTQMAGDESTQTAGDCSTQMAGDESTQTAGDCSTQTAGIFSTQTAGADSTQTAGDDSTHICKGDKIAIVNNYTGCLMQGNKGDTIQSCPDYIEGFVVNGMYKGESHIIADGILSKIVSQKGDVYKVVNYGEEKQSWLIKKGDVYAHGDTLNEAKEDLKYKFENRDLSEYKDITLDSVVTFEEAMQMYHDITGACSAGIKYFVEQNQDKVKDKYTVSEIMELTEGKYNHDKFKEFFND